MTNKIFVDWISISQLHQTEEQFPIYCRGIIVNYDSLGVEVLLVTVARINNSNQSRIDDLHLNRVG